jgi:hypothetical protein
VEGTWDELQAHAEDFRGHKLRLVVLPDSSEADDARQEEMTAAVLRMFAKADQLERSPLPQPSDLQKQEHQAILDEKYRTMGFKI